MRLRAAQLVGCRDLGHAAELLEAHQLCCAAELVTGRDQGCAAELLEAHELRRTTGLRRGKVLHRAAELAAGRAAELLETHELHSAADLHEANALLRMLLLSMDFDQAQRLQFPESGRNFSSPWKFHQISRNSDFGGNSKNFRHHRKFRKSNFQLWNFQLVKFQSF